MKKYLSFIVLFLLMFISVFAKGLITTHRNSLVIFPIQSSVSWRPDIAQMLLNKIEYEALNSNRFYILSRNNVDILLEEKRLAMVGITPNRAFETGQLLGANYAVLLELTRFTTDFRDGRHMTQGNIFLKLYQIPTSRLINSKQISVSSSGNTRAQSETYAVNYLTSEIIKSLIDFFPQQAIIQQIKERYVMLLGLDPSIVSRGDLFKVDDFNRNGYIIIEGYTSEYVYGKIRYGNVKEGDTVKEYPVADLWSSINLSYYNCHHHSCESGLSLGFSGLTSLYYYEIQGVIDFDIIFSRIPDIKFMLGGSYNILIDRINLYPFAGISFYFWEDNYYNTLNLSLGLSTGLKGFLEFNPKFGIGGNIAYNINPFSNLNNTTQLGINIFYRF